MPNNKRNKIVPTKILKNGRTSDEAMGKPVKKQKVVIDLTPGSSTGEEKSQKRASGSIEQGKESFATIIDPTPIEEFFRAFWEKKFHLIKRENSAFYQHLISLADIDDMLKKNNVEFTKNIDITSYRDGQRETHNPDGRALPAAVWDAYNDGCSIRLINPAKFLPEVYSLLGTLQEYFRCMVGANVYVTPPNNQGFAPHYDDIEAFVLQVEGKKRWRLYAPLSADETLPRESSGNMDEADIGKPILDTVLEAGDLLYFPRGFIHQANTVDDEYSLHLTVSMYQKNTWGDLMKIAVTEAIDRAMASDVSYRKGVPLDLFQNAGVPYRQTHGKLRQEYLGHFTSLATKVLSEFVDFDLSVDQFAKKYQQDALPPVLQPSELRRTAYRGNFEVSDDGVASYGQQLTERSRIRLLKANIVRLVEEKGVYCLYYHNENTRQYHETELSYFEVPASEVENILKLIRSYPRFIAVKDLSQTGPDEDEEEEKLSFAQDMFNKGLVSVDSVEES